MLPLFFIAWFVTPALAQDHPHTVLWKIEGHGLSHPSYLLGTQHDYDGALFLKDHPRVLQCIQQCTSIVSETLPGESPTGLDPSQLFFNGNSTLPQLLPPAQYDSIANYVRENAPGNDMLLQQLKKMRPQTVWMLMMELQRDSGSTTRPEMDVHIAQTAMTNGLKPHALETDSERTTALMASMQYQQFLDLVLQSIRRARQASPGKDTFAHKAYHDMAVDYALKQTPAIDGGGDRLRNQSWLHRIPAMIKAQGCFIVVGLDHLRATYGLIVGLRSQGYTVTPVSI